MGILRKSAEAHQDTPPRTESSAVNGVRDSIENEMNERTKKKVKSAYSARAQVTYWFH